MRIPSGVAFDELLRIRHYEPFAHGLWFLVLEYVVQILFRAERDETRQNDNPLARRCEDLREIRRL